MTSSTYQQRVISVPRYDTRTGLVAHNGSKSTSRGHFDAVHSYFWSELAALFVIDVETYKPRAYYVRRAAFGRNKSR